MPLLYNPHLMLLVTTLIWAGNAIAGKFAVGHVSPMVLTMERWAIALLLMLLFAYPKIKEDWPTLKKHWLYFLAMGGIGYTVFNFFLYSALQYISAINVTLEQTAMPVTIFILNFLLYKTKVTILQLFGYALTVLGVFVTVSAGDIWGMITSTTNQGLNLGDLFMLGAGLSYGGYSVGLRHKPAMHWQSFLTGLIAAAFFVSLFGISIELAANTAQFPNQLQGVLVVIFAALFPSLIAQGLFIKGVEALGANIAGLYINMVAVFGAFLSIFLLDESLHLFHAIAFILVVSGIYIAQRKTVKTKS